ncbi:hypothetical protein [Microbacterium sp. 2MCAF23]|uniref:hypothetical protein n=1 Tax=Microbacterium sp. 2MCAF23 TaxID=3232985 RepID=UPI003F9D30F5
MGRPDYEDSIAWSSGDADSGGETSVGYAYFGQGSSIGRVTEAARGSNLREEMATRMESDNEPA